VYDPKFRPTGCAGQCGQQGPVDFGVFYVCQDIQDHVGEFLLAQVPCQDGHLLGGGGQGQLPAGELLCVIGRVALEDRRQARIEPLAQGRVATRGHGGFTDKGQGLVVAAEGVRFQLSHGLLEAHGPNECGTQGQHGCDQGCTV